MGNRIGHRARLPALLAVALGLVAGLGTASGSTSDPAVGLARCPAGSVAAVVGGKAVCLRRGQRCQKRLDGAYHRYGFHCHAGRLTKGTKPKEPAPPRMPLAGTVIATIPAPSWGGIAIGAQSVWVANTLAHTVTRIDPETNVVTATIPTGESPFDLFHGPTRIGIGHGSVWVADGRSECSCLHRIDPAANRIVETIRLGTPTSPEFRVAPLGLAVTADAVWVTLRHGSEESLAGSVVRVDPIANAVTARIPVASDPDFGGPTGIAANAQGVWAGVPSTRSVARIDPATNTVVATTPGLSCGEGQLAADDSGVWIADCDVVRRIDPDTNAFAKTIRIPGVTGMGTLGIALGAGSVWAQAGPLVRIDSATGRIVGVSPLDPSLVWGEYAVAVGFGSVWVRQLDRVVRLRP